MKNHNLINFLRNQGCTPMPSHAFPILFPCVCSTSTSRSKRTFHRAPPCSIMKTERVLLCKGVYEMGSFGYRFLGGLKKPPWTRLARPGMMGSASFGQLRRAREMETNISTKNFWKNTCNFFDTKLVIN